MAGEQRILKLRGDGALVAEHLGEQRLIGLDFGDGVAPQPWRSDTDSQPLAFRAPSVSGFDMAGPYTDANP